MDRLNERKGSHLNTRLDKTRLTIGTYILQPYARTERHIKELADCGIDMVVCLGSPDTETLDLLEKYHIGAIVTGILPGWWGGNGGRMTDSIKLSDYAEHAKAFRDHPAIWGIDIGDEPSALDFPFYQKIIETIRPLFPEQFLYLNLFPNYASVAKNTEDQALSQLGTATYAEHIERYNETIGLDYISYDFYIYSCNNLGKMYDNFRIVADTCRKSGRDFWYIPQVNSLKEDVFTSENRLRVQAYTALAYGAVAINWACWTKGWWSNNVLDDEGNKTEQYEKLKAVNAELHAFSDIYMKYRRVDTHLTGFANESTFAAFPELTPVSEVNTGIFSGVRAENGESLVIGQFVGKTESDGVALLICNADDYLDSAPAKATVRFSCDRTVKLYSGEGIRELTRNGDGSYSFELENCHGVMITAK